MIDSSINAGSDARMRALAMTTERISLGITLGIDARREQGTSPEA